MFVFLALMPNTAKGEQWFGSLVYYDLVRLTRRGRDWLLRSGYALFLLVSLYLIYLHRFPAYAAFPVLFSDGPDVPPSQIARFAGTFATSVLILQSAAILILTPALVASSLTEERERGTLDLLFTSHLTDREILLSKLAGRLVHLISVLFAGVPVFFVLQWWGGVEPLLPAIAFLVLLVSVVSVGSICILCAAFFRSSFRAMLASYLIVLPVGLAGLLIPGCFLVSPAGLMLQLEGMLGAGDFHHFIWGPASIGGGGTFDSSLQNELVLLLMIYTFIHGAIAHSCLSCARRFLRRAPVWRRREHLAGARASGQLGLQSPTSQPHIKTPNPVTDAPLLWKEAYHGARTWANLPIARQFLFSFGIGLAIVLPILVLIGLVVHPKDSSFPWLWDKDIFSARTLNLEIRVAGAVMAGVWCLSVAWRACRCVSLERQQQTLDSLLTLPVDRCAILRAKWWGSMLRFRWLPVLVLSIYLSSVLYGATHWRAGFIVTAACGIHAAFLASLGIYLSQWCRNTLRANLAMAAVLGLMVFGTAAAGAYRPLFFGTRSVSWWDDFIQIGLNPIRAWQYLPMQWDEFKMEAPGFPGHPYGNRGATLAGLGVYELLAVAFWLAARRRFQRI
jgi:ABC-type transport system involved in multi-copper enzyme maturation permease subunit